MSTVRKQKRPSARPSDLPLTTSATYPRPLYLIAQLHDEMLRRLDQHMQTMQMTWALGRVFNAIATRPHISSAQLAKMFGITPQSVKQSVMTLEERGLVERVPSPSDQRVLGTLLTEKGRQLRSEHGGALDRMYKEVFGDIPKQDVDELTRIVIDVLERVRPASLDYFTDLETRENIGRGSITQKKAKN